MNRLVAAALAVALGLTLLGCGLLPTTPPAFEKVWWRAVLVAGRQPVAGQEPTLWFETGKFTGSGGCNQIGGLFAIAGNRITITELGGTAIGCPAPIGEIEGAFMKVLGGAESIRSDGQNLVIGGPAGEVVLRRDPDGPRARARPERAFGMVTNRPGPGRIGASARRSDGRVPRRGSRPV